MRRMLATGKDHVYLDARHFGDEKWRVRFPTILATCRSHGIDPVRELIPVAPACHYSSGGVADRPGRPDLRAGPVRVRRGRLHRRARREPARVELAARGSGLRAAGSPPHLADRLPAQREPADDARCRSLVDADARTRAAAGDDGGAGVLRSADGLPEAGATLGRAGRAAPQRARYARVGGDQPGHGGGRADRGRDRARGDRGSHWREDYPGARRRHWQAIWTSPFRPTVRPARPAATFVPHDRGRATHGRDRSTGVVDDLVRAALEEDLAGGVDVTTHGDGRSGQIRRQPTSSPRRRRGRRSAGRRLVIRPVAGAGARSSSSTRSATGHAVPRATCCRRPRPIRAVC